MAVAVRCDTARGRGNARALRRAAHLLLKAEGLSHCDLSVVLTDDAALHALNLDYRGKDQPTDVLSFSQLEQAMPRTRVGRYRPGRRSTDSGNLAEGTALGDVVISLDTARRQALRLKITAAERLRTLLIHGFLHVLGYDHERSQAEERRMLERERELAAWLADADAGRGARRARKSRGGR